MTWGQYIQNPSRYDVEERGFELVEAWNDGNRTFVVDELYKMPKKRAIATAVYITRYLRDRDTGELTELLMRSL